MIRLRLCFALLAFAPSLFASAQSVDVRATVQDIEKAYRFLVDRESTLPRPSLIKVLDSLSSDAQASGQLLKDDYLYVYRSFQKAMTEQPLDSAVYRFSRAYDRLSKNGDKALLAWYHFKLGQTYYYRNDNANGFLLMLQAISEARSIGFERVPLISYMLYDMSTYYYHFSNYRTAIEMSTVADQFGANYPRSAGILNTWALCYQKLGRYDSAILKFTEAQKLAEKQSDCVWTSIIKGNLGRTLCLQGNYAAGLPLLRFDMLSNQETEPVNSALSALYMADAYRLQGRADSASHYINLAKQIFQLKNPWSPARLGISTFGAYYFEQLAKVNAATGRFNDAYRYQDSSQRYREQYRSIFDLNLLSASEKKVQGMEYQQSLQLAEADRRNSRLQSLVLIISLGAVLLIAALFISRQRLKFKKERQLLREQENNLLLRKEQADRELQTAKTQLDEYVRFLSEKNELIEKISGELEKQVRLNANPAGRLPLNDAVQQLTDATLLTREEWQEFRQKFDRVHPGFFSRLSSAFPGISPADERILALSKLRIHTHQMGRMLGISPESVRKAKYRLRKKLPPGHQEDLSELLEQF